MRFLLDTVAFIWLAEGDSRLREPVVELLIDPSNEVFLSAASVWEIVIKYSLGRLVLRVPPSDYVMQQRELHRIETLSIDERSALAVGGLPELHRDPFDRIIVAQAIVHDLTVVTTDRLIKRYPVQAIW